MSTQVDQHGIPLGLLTYPVLMAADILLYKADSVPVGEDQSQNIELAREIGAHFNNKYKTDVFKIPEKIVQSNYSNRIKSLRDPASKMSKSEQVLSGNESNPGLISIIDTADQVTKKVRRAVTDSNPCIYYDPENRPGVSNLISIYCVLTDQSEKVIESELQTLDTLGLKNRVIEVRGCQKFI